MVQKTVSVLPSLGLPGQAASTIDARYLAYNPLSDGTVTVGTFAFAKTAGGTDSAPFAIASLTNSNLVQPLGFVERVQDETLTSVLTSYSNVIPEGGVCEIAVEGQFYFEVPTGLSSITAGMGVFVKPADGDVSLAASNPDNTTYVDTGWTVVIPNGGASADAGDIVILEKF